MIDLKVTSILKRHKSSNKLGAYKINLEKAFCIGKTSRILINKPL